MGVLTAGCSEVDGAQTRAPQTAVTGGRMVRARGWLAAFAVALAADTNGVRDVFVRDRAMSTTERVSVSSDGTQSNGASLYPSISSDGRFVAFQSEATNLVDNDTNGVTDIFVRDRNMNVTERVC